MTRRPTTYGNNTTWPDTCTHPSTHTERAPASGYYDDSGRSVTTPARDIERCDNCGATVPELGQRPWGDEMEWM